MSWFKKLTRAASKADSPKAEINNPPAVDPNSLAVKRLLKGTDFVKTVRDPVDKWIARLKSKTFKELKAKRFAVMGNSKAINPLLRVLIMTTSLTDNRGFLNTEEKEAHKVIVDILAKFPEAFDGILSAL